jgi:hypothetical protein
MQHQTKPVENFSPPGTGQVVEDDADRPGAPLGKAACDRVGPVPSSATALRTACRFSSLTRGEFCSTSDTSDLDTPALAATVRMVGGLPMEGSLAMPDLCGGRHPHVGAPYHRGLGLTQDHGTG